MFLKLFFFYNKTKEALDNLWLAGFSIKDALQTNTRLQHTLYQDYLLRLKDPYKHINYCLRGESYKQKSKVSVIL